MRCAALHSAASPASHTASVALLRRNSQCSMPSKVGTKCCSFAKSLGLSRPRCCCPLLTLPTCTHLQVLVRELSRDALELLRALFGSTSTPSIPAAQLSALSSSNPNAFGAAQRQRGGFGERAALQPVQPDGVGGHGKLNLLSDDNGGKPGSTLQSIPWGRTAACALLQARAALHDGGALVQDVLLPTCSCKIFMRSIHDCA